MSRACVAVSVVASLAGALVVAVPAVAAERVWLAPSDIAPGVAPQVAVDAQGRAVMAWTSDGVRSADRPAGGGWQAPIALSAGGGGATDLAIGPRGSAAVMWSEDPSTMYYPYPSTVVYGVARPPGGGWRPRVQLGRADGVITKERGLSGGEDVAIDPDGNAIAVWKLVSSIEGATVPAGGAWGKPVELATLRQDGPAPQVTVDGQGRAIAVWSTSDGPPGSEIGLGPPPSGRYVVQTTELAPGAAWQRPLRPVALSAASENALDPQIAVNARGDAIAAWTAASLPAGAPAIVRAAVRPAGENWAAPLDVSVRGTVTGPRVAIDPRGNVISIWVRARGTRSVVQSAARPFGGAWSPPVNLSAYRRGMVETPQVAFDAQGNAIAVWEAPRRGRRYVYAANRPAGGGWSSPVALSGADADAPQVALGPQGDAIVVWSREKGKRAVIQAADYASGPAISRLRASASTVTFTLNVPAQVRFQIERARSGRQIGERCVRPTRARRKRKPCVRYARVTGALSASGSAGASQLRFDGRVAGRRLARGRYRLVGTPRAGGRTGRSIRTGFRIGS